MRPSYLDWIARAAAAKDPAQVERCLDEACAQAERCHEWRAILNGAAEIAAASRSRLIALATRTLESAGSERAIWGFRDVATVRSERLDDAAGARAALDACLEAFLRPAEVDELECGFSAYGEPPQGYEWVLLAGGFVETLDDRDRAQGVLEQGRALARSAARADDLCSVAVAWAELVDREAGVALLREAEALASNGSARPRTLANAWFALGNAAGQRRVLDRALDDASTVGAAIEVARAWASHRRRTKAERALARAEQLAASVPEWLVIGEAALDLGLGDVRVRRVLERAEALASATGASGEQISAAYLHWLADSDAAERVGPRGVAPASMRQMITPPLLPTWDRSASALFDHLRARISEDELLHIANADYGSDAAKHLAALRDLCDSGLVPRELAWEPHEALALTRWSSGERVNHVERALASLLLCLAPSELDEFVTNGVILAESCLELGPVVSDHAEQFFAWFASSVDPDDYDDDDEPNPDRVLALLLLFVLRVASSPEDPRLATLAEVLLTPPGRLEAAWASIAETMREDLWRDLVPRTLPADHSPSARVLGAVLGPEWTP